MAQSKTQPEYIKNLLISVVFKSSDMPPFTDVVCTDVKQSTDGDLLILDITQRVIGRSSLGKESRIGFNLKDVLFFTISPYKEDGQEKD